MMTPKKLKILMIQHDVRPADIARRLKVTDQTIWAIRNGYSSSKRIENAIATACGVRREDIFPIIPVPRRRNDAA